MNPVISIQDNFFRDIEATRESIISGLFEDIANPLDGIVYPAIQKALPPHVQHEVISGIQFMLGRRPVIRALFARAMYSDMIATNKIHSDMIMGSYAAHIYLSKEWPEGSGTTFWSNKHVGMRHHKGIDESLVRTNELDDWDRYLSVQAKCNRLLIHRGDAWHLAEPIGGWGKSPDDGRLVITCFFN